MEQIVRTVHFKGKDICYGYYPRSTGKDKDFAKESPSEEILTLMLVHGFPERGRIFKEQIAALSLRYNLIVPDLPGSGDSPFNPELHTTADFAEALKTVTDQENNKKLVMIGHSMGGYIALAFGEKYPEKMLGLGLLHSTAYQDSEAKKANRLKAIQTMERYGGPTFLKSMIPSLFSADFKAQHPEVIQDLIAAGSRFETRSLQRYYQMMHDRKDKTCLFDRLKIPYLLVSGTEDMAAPAADLREQAALADTVLLEILPDTGHMGFIEKPEMVNKILNAFMHLVQVLQKT